MSPDTFDKIKLLADKTAQAFNFYATMDVADPETSKILKERGLSYYALYSEIADTLAIPDEIAAQTEQGFIHMAKACDESGHTKAAEKLRLCAKITTEVIEEMNLPEGSCPTKSGTKEVTAKVIARYPELQNL